MTGFPASYAATASRSVSVLRSHVEALGGRLKVSAESDDSIYLVAKRQAVPS